MTIRPTTTALPSVPTPPSSTAPSRPSERPAVSPAGPGVHLSGAAAAAASATAGEAIETDVFRQAMAFLAGDTALPPAVAHRIADRMAATLLQDGEVG